jgi:hypothetical protein
MSVVGCMLVLRGKFYYVAPVYPIVFAPGAVSLERLTAEPASKWFRPVYALTMLMVGALIAPTAIPLLSIEGYIAYTKKLGIQQQKFENQPESQLPQIFADMVGWEERVKIVADYVHSLPPDEQQITAIGASNYGDAGAVDLFGSKYGSFRSGREAGGFEGAESWAGGFYECAGERERLGSEGVSGLGRIGGEGIPGGLRGRGGLYVFARGRSHPSRVRYAAGRGSSGSSHSGGCSSRASEGRPDPG